MASAMKLRPLDSQSGEVHASHVEKMMLLSCRRCSFTSLGHDGKKPLFFTMSAQGGSEIYYSVMFRGLEGSRSRWSRFWRALGSMPLFLTMRKRVLDPLR